VLDWSLCGDAELLAVFVLLLRQGAEEVDFVLRSRLPLVIRLECRLEVRFDIHIERLRLKLTIGWVVDAGDGLGR
jgi:hypothetical protein